jgi:hypothetical protein
MPGIEVITAECLGSLNSFMQDFELQDLAEQVGNLMKETVGLSLRFHLQIELGPALQVSETTLTKVNNRRAISLR